VGKEEGSLFHFDLIHCDIWGHFSTKSVNGSAYFLKIIDHHSRFTWVHLMQHKPKTITHIQIFFFYDCKSI
jgi:pentose-5-phosphate-3-epimerase